MNIIASFFEFLSVLGIDIPVAYRMWILGVIVVFLFPRILRSIYTSQARKLFKSSQLYYNEERRKYEDMAIAKVKNNPHALIGLAADAAQVGRDDFVHRVLLMLPDSPKWKRESRQLLLKYQPKKNPPSLEGILMRIDSLLHDEEYDAAESHLRRGLQEWPDEPELNQRLAHIKRSRSS